MNRTEGLNELRGKAVKVYYNSHKKCFSVKCGKEPIKHANNLMIADVKFIVNEGGRQRVISEGRKNVHAFVTGTLVGADFENLCETEEFERVTYNPYTHGYFYRADTREAVEAANMAMLYNKQIWTI